MDKIIEQRPEIAVQIAKALQGHEGPLTINASINEKEEPQAMNDEAILYYIATFPEPRLRNFIDHIYFIATKKYGGKYQAAGQLSVCYNTLHRVIDKERLIP